MDLRKLLDKLESIKEADLTPQQQAQNVLQPGSQKSGADLEKEKEYARAQQQMDRLEKAAKYSGDDEVVRSRMGLPPKLPSIDQWDGKMPQPSGKPDWLARLSGADKSQADAVATNKADDSSTAFKKEKLTKLNSLVSQLKNILNPSNATANTTGGANLGQVNKEASIFESLLREFEDEVLEQDAPKNKEEIVKQIQAIMGELGDMGDDPEINDALTSAQQAIDDAAKAPEKKDSAKPDATKVARFKELLAKAGQGTKPAPAGAPAPKTESMSELMARVQRIAEGRIDEALTPEEKTELDALAKELEAFTGQDPELDALLLQHTKLAQAPADAGQKKVAGADPAIQKVQEQLKALGVDPGPIDGKMGPKTIAGIKAFEKMAGKPETGKVTPELSTLLADGKNVVARSQLTQSLTAIEAIVTKYKISESVTEEDVLAMTEEEAKAFVMKNIKYFSEAEQIAITRDYLSEAPVPALPGPGGKLPALPGSPAGNPNVIDVPFRDVTPKPSWGQRALGAIKTAGNFLNPRRAVVAAAAALGLGGLWKAFSGGDIEMDPKDLAELQKHLKVLDQYGQDPAIKAGLPADVQKRLDVVIGKLGKLKSAKATGAEQPAAPAKPAAPAPKNNVDMSGGAGAF
jgi:peptidoglycan hydrolase-like protein with peptidoglycan-binding domain